jgi:hypothetical protein
MDNTRPLADLLASRQRARDKAEHAADRGVVLSPYLLLGDLDQPTTEAVPATDRKGRTLAERVAAIERGGDPVTEDQQDAATALLADLLTAAARHGITLDDFDWTVDLPGGCLNVILSKRPTA